ncbi:DUF1217 domain-containing protein [Telmatospirillum sp. J64-1]|uniref:DUF1217 domain-containing protein n=1 Tax=Telmatospirillum sp. J64-1 TaxID=2502183 RepID=UPI00115D0640|nr:DUF1217 domain-containing protein [Telmatospirillum sp. J64-1]
MIGALVGGFSGSSISGYRVVKSQMDMLRESFAKQPEIQREIAKFKEAITSVETPHDLVNNYQAYTFAMHAFGLEERIFAKAFMQKAHEEGLTDKNALANRMLDPRVREMVEFFDFEAKQGANMKDPAWIDKIVDKYITAQFEASAESGNPAVRQALYAERKAPTLNSWMEVLADKDLSEVFRAAAGLPPESARMDIDKQVALLEKRFNIEDLKDPVKLGKIIDRFLANYDIRNGGSSMAMSIPNMLLSNSTTGYMPIIQFDPSLFLALRPK